jgi:Restriction endonuclease
MTRVTDIDLLLIDELFESDPGYVMDFTNSTFSRFFQNELGVDIYSDRFAAYGTSKAKRLRCYLQSVGAEPAAKALKALWSYRTVMFRRAGRQDDDADAQEHFQVLLAKLEDRPQPQPTSKPKTEQRAGPDRAILAKHAAELVALTGMDPQRRGYAFEPFLKNLFSAYGIKARGSFRLVGEQIDGSFMLANEPYLLEARWQNAQTDAADLHAFHGKCTEKAAWTRGLFVSQSGFSEQGLRAFGKKKTLICMDGLDLHDTLRRGLHLEDVLLAKVWRAGDTGAPFVRVRELFPE